ncbi:MAG: hypothetical protein HRU17_21285 [Polyangiaceae bacterium]|nr:hypothetical protein [Polyangiaceae bacterium]
MNFSRRRVLSLRAAVVVCGLASCGVVGCESGLEGFEFVAGGGGPVTGTGGTADATAGDSSLQLDAGFGGELGVGGTPSGSTGATTNTGGVAVGGVSGAGGSAGGIGGVGVGGNSGGQAGAGTDPGCPEGAAFLAFPYEWSGKEGDALAVNAITFSVDWGDERQDWDISLEDHPAWLSVQFDIDAVRVQADEMVPYQSAGTYEAKVILDHKFSSCRLIAPLTATVEPNFSEIDDVTVDLDGATAAAWNYGSDNFIVLVGDKLREFDPLSPASIVRECNIPGSAVDPSAVAASGDTAFVVSDSKLYRVTLSTCAADAGLAVSGDASGFSLAHAGDRLLVGNAGAVTVELKDGATSFVNETNAPFGLQALVSDGQDVAFSDASNNTVYGFDPGVSSAGTFCTPNGPVHLSVLGERGAMVSTTASLSYFLQFFSVVDGGCTIGNSYSVALKRAVVALGRDGALLVASTVAATATVHLVNSDGVRYGDIIVVNVGSVDWSQARFATGPDHALLVTTNSPVLFVL